MAYVGQKSKCQNLSTFLTMDLSCENQYPRPKTASGKDKLIIFSKTDSRMQNRLKREWKQIKIPAKSVHTTFQVSMSYDSI